jgi:hypothetical protein
VIQVTEEVSKNNTERESVKGQATANIDFTIYAKKGEPTVQEIHTKSQFD